MMSGSGHVLALGALSIQSGGSIPAIDLTAVARPEDRNRALAAGFQLPLAKPVEESELLAALGSVFAAAD